MVWADSWLARNEGVVWPDSGMRAVGAYPGKTEGCGLGRLRNKRLWSGQTHGWLGMKGYGLARDEGVWSGQTRGWPQLLAIVQ